ncbi:hypothetical protein H9P43_007905 [Blastocladiella emersonii ATCC 22665]|nr:hypothetical protein H9P43_007905 [Blastocladiella emersonii ATCC 22665]
MSTRAFLKTWYRPEVSPIIAVVAVALSGASYYVFRLARHQEVVWTKDNPQPWNKVEQNQTTKFINMHPGLTDKFKREW